MCLSLCVLEGGRDHKDHEGLHQHDRQEALQRHVRHQHRQRMDEVIDASQTDYRRVSNEIASERKSPCVEPGNMSTQSEKGRARNTEVSKHLDHSLFGETYSHCYKAQQILQSCDVNPPSLNAGTTIAGLLSHLKFFSLSSSLSQKCSSCDVLDERCTSLCSLLLFKLFPHFPDFIMSGT